MNDSAKNTYNLEEGSNILDPLPPGEIKHSVPHSDCYEMTISYYILIFQVRLVTKAEMTIIILD